MRYCVACENPETLTCEGCGEEKPRSAFHQSKNRSWLRKFCGKCRYAGDREAILLTAKKRHAHLRRLVFKAYGSVCACCGEHRETMLTIDHVNNDGAEHRKALMANAKTHKWRSANIGGTALYADLVRRKFPSGFQLLCANCNASKSRNGGVCEHQTEGATTIPRGSTAKRPEAPNIPANGMMI